MIQYLPMNEMNRPEAVELATQEYIRECKKCSQLVTKDFTERIEELISEISKCRYGMAAVEEGSFIGYLAFLGPWDGFFGNCKGVFSPLAGNAFGGKHPDKTASMLFAKVAEEMAKDGVFSYALSRYAHDEEIARSFVMNGFGIRCSDAILRLSDYHMSEPVPNITCQEIAYNEKRQVEHLFHDLSLHLVEAPCFFPVELVSADSWFFLNTEKRVFVAKDGENIVGYMALQNAGENFISNMDSMYNICGAYVAEDYRNTGVAKQLLDFLVQISKVEGMEYLGVDCETLNPTALRFWGKYFQNYTYSFHRRIDERVQNYQQYFDSVYPNHRKLK